MSLPAEIQEIFTEMNQKLATAIHEYENDEIEEEELRDRIEELIKLKIRAMGRFPQIFGKRYFDWYIDFAKFDKYLNEAWSESFGFGPEADVVKYLKWAKSHKESLERMPGDK